MLDQATLIHTRIQGREFAQRMMKVREEFSTDGALAHYKQLEKMGVYLDNPKRPGSNFVRPAMDHYPLDPLQPSVTTPSSPVPVQFLQEFFKGFVDVLTGKRLIDDAINTYNVGTFSTAQIVQGEMEYSGQAVPYGDANNLPYSSFNVNWLYRTVQQFEIGMKVPLLQTMQAIKADIDFASSVRTAAINALEILRNAIGFWGWNNGVGLTYGLLNEPNLLPYEPVPAGASGETQWVKKSYLEIMADIKLGASVLRQQSREQVNGHSDLPMTLLVSSAVADQLDSLNPYTTDTVLQSIKANYKTMRVISAPELDEAYAGDNVFYMYADRVADSSTDDGFVFAQCIASKFQMLGSELRVKESIEAYANALAGVLCKRPYACVRFYGI